MGTNYYWHERDACETCGRPYEPRHIGKSSAGWCFSLRTYPEDGILDLPDWERLWAKPGSKIVDEYGQAISIQGMRDTIANRGSEEDKWEARPIGYNSWQEFHAFNHSRRGPRGLLRHSYKATPGDGTWDLCPYEFS